MKKGVLLHRLIVAELALALGHGTFIFLHAPAYGWYLSVTAVGLTISHSLHNVIAWMKIRGFFPPWGTRLYLITLLAAQLYWVVEIYANFAFFNRGQALYTTTRPLEPLFRCGGPLVDLHNLLSPGPHLAGLWVFAGATDPHQPTFRRHAPVHGDFRRVCGGGHVCDPGRESPRLPPGDGAVLEAGVCFQVPERHHHLG
ncbi:hypothetical protein AnigIFM63309_004391 [Aspergillus niger]|nr:hypothetical protein AnigIFM63309_004391 [Aspergillus niger]